MISFTILTIVLLCVAALVLIPAGVVGSALLVVFGDIIVFAFIIALIVKLIKGKKK